MWLMCHRNGERTVAVEQVHADQELSTILHSLVSELVAVVSLRLGNQHPSNTKFSNHYILQPDLNALKHAHTHTHTNTHTNTNTNTNTSGHSQVCLRAASRPDLESRCWVKTCEA